jgi:ABC-type sulfate/molybdate transport systems ATPase subunit
VSGEVRSGPDDAVHAEAPAQARGAWRAEIRTSAGLLSLDVELEGSARPLAVVGPNGSGKTTLLRSIAGAHGPVTGSIVVDGVTLLDTDAGVDLPIEDRGVGYVPQGYGLFPHLTVLDNVAFGLSHGPDRVPAGERMYVARRMLEELECTQLARRLPGRLSGGEQQRVALARALVIEPRLLLLDEPLAALDATARRSLRGLLARKLRSLERPSIVVTHDVRDVLALDAEVCVIEAGRIVQRGRIKALRDEPATDFVAEFVGVEG